MEKETENERENARYFRQHNEEAVGCVRERIMREREGARRRQS